MGDGNQQSPRRELYPLGPDNGYFEAGVAADGRQVLMGFFWTGLIGLFFDRAGSFIEQQTKPLPSEPPRHPVSGSYLSTPDFDHAVSLALHAWKAEIGFKPRLIRVRPFSVGGLGIEDRPSHYEEFLADPESDAWFAEERDELRKECQDWDERGCFVLHWGNDLWLNGDGSVESS